MWTIVLMLLVLWFLGFITSNTLGGLVHILLVIAIVVMAVSLLQGRRVV
ncbi:MAG TPA: lmo0937 family membrane protein [Longimicrobiales bacterium]|nr:lmo0937 family membrane protein [Longimicrobiales bacterium]